MSTPAVTAQLGRSEEAPRQGHAQVPGGGVAELQACLVPPGASSGWRRLEGRRRWLEFAADLLKLLEARVPHMRGRAQRIEEACRIIGEALHNSGVDPTSLVLTAQFHEIGMLGLPDALLLKQTEFTADERVLMQQHASVSGHLLAKGFPDFPDAVEAIWYHHEWYDGSGPNGLEGDEIPIAARILSVVEAIESMANDRPYRAKRPWQEILKELIAKKGKQFDPVVIEVCGKLFARLYSVLAVSDKAKGSEAETATAGGASCEAAQAPAASTLSASPQQEASQPGPGGANSAERGGSTKAGKYSSAQSLENLTPVITKEDLLNLVTKGLELRPLAPIAKNVMAVTAHARCAIEDVAKEIINDQALSIRILKMANSSAFSRGKPVSDLKTAIGRIGLQEVRNLAMTLSVLEYYEGRVSEFVDPRMFWEHSIGCGLIASAIADACQLKAMNEQFLFGMLHDLGRLVLLDHVSEPYANVWDATAALDLPMEKVESRLMMLDHCEIVARSLDHWGFSREFIIPVVNHHQTVQGLKRLGKKHVEGAAIVALADRISHALLLGSSGNDVIYPIDDLVDLLGVNHDVMGDLAMSIPCEVQSLHVVLLSRDSTEPCCDYTASVKKRLSAEFRPLCTSKDPPTDAFRLFCERISNTSGNGPPNIGVIYLADIRQFDELIRKHEASEQEAKCGALPVIVVCNRGRFKDDHPWFRNRQCIVLKAPVRVDRFVGAVNDLLG